MKRFLVVLVALTMLVSVAYAEEIHIKPYEVELTGSESVTIRVNVAMPAETTWDFVVEDDNVVELITSEFNGDEPDFIGETAQYAASFRAVPEATGETKIIFTETGAEDVVCGQLFFSVRAENGSIFLDVADAYKITEQSEITFYLEANATTGYAWTYAMDTDKCLNFVSDDYIAFEAEDGAVGAGGVYAATFETAMNGAGMTAIHFVYARSFEGGETARGLTCNIWTNESGTFNVESVVFE